MSFRKDKETREHFYIYEKDDFEKSPTDALPLASSPNMEQVKEWKKEGEVIVQETLVKKENTWETVKQKKI